MVVADRSQGVALGFYITAPSGRIRHESPLRSDGPETRVTVARSTHSLIDGLGRPSYLLLDDRRQAAHLNVGHFLLLA